MFDLFYPRRWRIKFVQRFRSQVFAYRHVIIPAVTHKRKFLSLKPESIRKRLWRAHLLWFNRIKELACRELWFPSPRYNSLQTKKASVQRCMYCRPTNLVYRWPRGEVELRLCGRFNSCPFCSARAAEDLYKRVSRAIKGLQKRGVFAIATCRIVTYKITAADFAQSGWDIANVYANAEKLRELLKGEQYKYKKLRKQLRAQTFGSMWRVVVNPVDDGWEIQIRQFFITRPRARRPVNRARKASAIFLQSAKINDFQATMELLGCFVKYPSGLLTSYVELTAAVFHARNNLRLTNATGCLYQRGRKHTPKVEAPPVIIPFIP